MQSLQTTGSFLLRIATVFLRNCSNERRVEVRDSKTMKILWQAEIADGNIPLFSVSNDGRYLIHVRGNHQVKKISDVCVEIFQQSGPKRRICCF